MGIGKKAVSHKGKKVVENVTEDIPVVGDLVDRNVYGPDEFDADASLASDHIFLVRELDHRLEHCWVANRDACRFDR